MCDMTAAFYQSKTKPHMTDYLANLYQLDFTAAHSLFVNMSGNHYLVTAKFCFVLKKEVMENFILFTSSAHLTTFPQEKKHFCVCVCVE